MLDGVDVAAFQDELEKATMFFRNGQRSEQRKRDLLFFHHLELSQPLLADYFGGEPGFYHSVASGDPLPNAVVIW